jgi:hypothetical protein
VIFVVLPLHLQHKKSLANFMDEEDEEEHKKKKRVMRKI